MKLLKALGRGADQTLPPADLRDVADALSRGKLAVYPTDTLYALGADPYDRGAVKALYALKGKPLEEPVALMVHDAASLAGIATVPDAARALLERTLPGPVTFILPPGPEAPPPPIAGPSGIGLRVPDHPVARAIAARYGPVTCTSANLHGKPPPREVHEAMGSLGDAVDVYVDGGPCPLGVPSTVVDFTGERGRVLREGALTATELGLDEP